MLHDLLRRKGSDAPISPAISSCDASGRLKNAVSLTESPNKKILNAGKTIERAGRYRDQAARKTDEPARCVARHGI
jgi:hypothetical protein